MGIMCALGLASCISIGGASYSESDAFDIIYECDMARSAGYFSEVSFILVDGKYRFGMQDGYRQNRNGIADCERSQQPHGKQPDRIAR